MAKSGQCSSQKWQPVQASGSFTSGRPCSSLSKTSAGQKAIQIPHALHQSWKISCLKSFLPFFSSFFLVSQYLSASLFFLLDCFLLFPVAIIFFLKGLSGGYCVLDEILLESLSFVDVFQEKTAYLSGNTLFLSFRFGCIMVNGRLPDRVKIPVN